MSQFGINIVELIDFLHEPHHTVFTVVCFQRSEFYTVQQEFLHCNGIVFFKMVGK